MFDGLLVEKSNDQNLDPLELEFPAIEKLIKEQTGFSINIITKSTDTEWTPIIQNIDLINKVDEQVYQKFDREYLESLYMDCFDKEKKKITGNCRILVDYLNNFVCLFERPQSFGWRHTIDQDFDILKKSSNISILILCLCFITIDYNISKVFL